MPQLAFRSLECLSSVHFWGLSGSIFRTRCKRGTSPDFLEAKWIDNRGICSPVDVLDSVTTRCVGARECVFLPVSAKSEEQFNDLGSALQLSIPDDCDDTRSRKLLGTYRCVGMAFSRVLSASNL